MTIDTLTKFSLTLPEKPHRTEAAKNHFNDMGLRGVTFVPGINGEKFGLRTVWPYSVDDRSGKFFCGPHETGIFLSHLMLWVHAMLSCDVCMILEDDAKLQDGWKEKADAALRDVPTDFDFLFLGSCATAGAAKNHVKGNVWNVRWPACFHAYVITRKGAEYLVETQRKMFGPCDLMTYVEDPNGGSVASFKQMKVYCALPRMIDQWNTEIAP